MKSTKLLAVVFSVLIVLSLVAVSAGKKSKNLQECENSDNLFSYKLNKNSGYETYTYFSPEYDYLGMEQFDGEGNLLIDTFSGVC